MSGRLGVAGDLSRVEILRRLLEAERQRFDSP